MKKKRESKLGTVFCTPQIVSAVKRAKFLGDRMSYIVLRGRRCNIIVLNMNAPIEERRDDTKDSLCEELQQVFDHFLIPYQILSGYFNVKFGKEDTFKPTIWNESLDQDSNDKGVRIVNFATSKNLFVKSMMFPHRIIHKTPGHLLLRRLTTRLITY